MHLKKAKGAKPGKNQTVRACPYCGQDILISQGEAKGRAKLDSFWLGVVLMAVVLVVMLMLMIGGGA